MEEAKTTGSSWVGTLLLSEKNRPGILEKKGKNPGRNIGSTLKRIPISY